MDWEKEFDEFTASELFFLNGVMPRTVKKFIAKTIEEEKRKAKSEELEAFMVWQWGTNLTAKRINEHVVDRINELTVIPTKVFRQLKDEN